MNVIYDTSLDNLKCNFCTKWFQCTSHFANIQRYCIKVCEKCFNNFTYSIIHPHTYKVYKIILFDSNICLKQKYENNNDDKLYEQIIQIQNQTICKITQQYQQKINKILEKKLDTEQTINNQFQQLKRLSLKQNLRNQQREQILKKLANIKRQKFNYQQQKQNSCIKNKMRQSRNNFMQFNKQNICQNKAIGKNIRLKISGCDLKKPQLSSSRYIDQSFRSISKPKSMWSSKQSSSQKRIPSFIEKQRLQVIHTLGQKIQGDRYIPTDVCLEQNILAVQSHHELANSILDLKKKTTKDGQLIQLIGPTKSKIPFQNFLMSLGSQTLAKTIRLIRIPLKDKDFDSLLRFVAKNNQIQTLIVTNNLLTENSIFAIDCFYQKNPNSKLTNIYVGNNKIKKDKIISIKQKLMQNGRNIHY